MITIDWTGLTVKFSITGAPRRGSDAPEVYDCYLQIGEVDAENQTDYPHLKIGEPCHFDLTLSRVGEEMRVYSLLTTLVSQLIIKGESPRDIALLFIGQCFEPAGWVELAGESHRYSSIPDFIGKYILTRYYQRKEE